MATLATNHNDLTVHLWTDSYGVTQQGDTTEWACTLCDHHNIINHQENRFFTEFKSICMALWVMKYFPFFNPFSLQKKLYLLCNFLQTQGLWWKKIHFHSIMKMAWFHRSTNQLWWSLAQIKCFRFCLKVSGFEISAMLSYTSWWSLQSCRSIKLHQHNSRF